MSGNLNRRDVTSFGYEWSTFDQRSVPDGELKRRFESYFSLFPWDRLPTRPVGFDLGCGSGRWAKFVAPKVATLHCIDASADALRAARLTTRGATNCTFHHASVDAIPLDDASMDFGYSLGVLHHVPDTLAGLRSCVSKLKWGAPFLLYLYYALDNRSPGYRALFHTSSWIRKSVTRLPCRNRRLVTDLIAATIYWPLARLSRAAEARDVNVSEFPLSIYRDMSFQTMRTDAYDRFATELEQRFTRQQIATMMTDAGLSDISFREAPPYWCAIGYRSK